MWKPVPQKGFRRFHALFPYVRVRAKTFDANVFLLFQYAFCTGRKRRRANNSADAHAETYSLFNLLIPHAQDRSTVPVRFLFLSQKEVV